MMLKTFQINDNYKMVFLCIFHAYDFSSFFVTYRQISNIKRTKSQAWNVSRLVL